jgi:hypothetical protein
MPATAAHQSTVAQQFEYVRLFISRNPHGSWLVEAVSLGLAGHVGAQRGADVDSALAALGIEGWEVAGAPGSVDQFHLMLKRAKVGN